MNKLLIGRYLPGNSLLHRMDPRAKLSACMLLFIVIIFLASGWLAYALLWGFTWIVIQLTGVTVRIYLRGVRPLLYLILFTTTMQILFTAGGTIYVDWGLITISSYGIVYGLALLSRFMMLIFISTAITLTTKPVDLSDGIQALLRPLAFFKLPVDDLSLMLSISLRFIPTILDETQKVIDAQRARGAAIGEGNIFQQMKTLVPILLPLFASSLQRAEDLANGMEVRGYESGAKRSSFRQFSWKRIDTIGIAIILLFTAILFPISI